MYRPLGQANRIRVGSSGPGWMGVHSGMPLWKLLEQAMAKDMFVRELVGRAQAQQRMGLGSMGNLMRMGMPTGQAQGMARLGGQVRAPQYQPGGAAEVLAQSRLNDRTNQALSNIQQQAMMDQSPNFMEQYGPMLAMVLGALSGGVLAPAGMALAGASLGGTMGQGLGAGLWRT